MSYELPVKDLFFFTIVFALFFSCKKEGVTTSADAILRTDVDTLHFDTVFTTTGSFSQLFKIINENDKTIKVSSVRLAGGTASPFKINVDGIPGPETRDIEIASNDSAYVYITVSINPNATNLPFIVRDSIEINYNGNKRWVQLDAYGQNAHFFRNTTITTNEVWNNDLPYVVLGRLTVQPNITLTINKGCKIFMHGDAPFIVSGTLQVNGNDSSRVIFSGDRLDEPYRDFPASFPGLIFTQSSKNNIINYAIIKNAYQAVIAVEPASGTKLTLNESIIDNAYDIGLFGINTSITAKNLLVSNCGKNIVLVQGGTYNFTHCTVASFSNIYIQHKEPVLLLSNFLKQDNVVTTGNLNATFRNCIFWGESGGLVKSEVVTAKQGTAAFNVLFDNVLWGVPSAPENVTITGTNIKDQNPQFDSINVSDQFYSFRLKQTSPAKDKGVNAGVTIDLDGKSRPVGLPDLGAYEKH